MSAYLSRGGFSVTLLTAIWLSAAVLLILSSLLFVALVIVRSVRGKAEIQARKTRARISDMVMRYTMGGVPDYSALPALSNHERRILRDMCRGLVDGCSGPERQTFIKLMKGYKIDAMCREEVLGSDPSRREVALMTLSIFGREAVEATAVAALEDAEPAVRINAVRVLADYSGAITPRALAEHVSESDVRSSAHVYEAFYSMVDDYKEELINLMNDRSLHTDVRSHIMNALMDKGVRSAIPTLIDIATSGDIELQAEAFRGLGKLKATEAEGCVRKGLAHPNWIVKSQAAIAAGRIGFVGLSDVLEHMISDENWWVSFRSAEALVRMPGGKERLEKLSGDQTAAGKTAAYALSFQRSFDNSVKTAV